MRRLLALLAAALLGPPAVAEEPRDALWAQQYLEDHPAGPRAAEALRLLMVLEPYARDGPDEPALAVATDPY